MGKRKDTTRHRKRKVKKEGTDKMVSRSQQYAKARHLAKGSTQEEIDTLRKKAIHAPPE